jgi:hypothetical protein
MNVRGASAVAQSLVLRHWSLAGLVFVLCCGGCRDPQSAALQQLTAKGYSLSVPEFFKAARAGDAEAIKLFITAGVAPNVVGAEGRTALREAARAGQVVSLKALLQVGAQLPKEGAAANALLADAVRSHQLPVVLALLEMSHHTDSDMPAEDAPLVVAAAEQQEGMLRALLPVCAGQKDAALLAASETGNLATLRLLLIAGASVATRDAPRGRTPLMIAAAGGFNEAVEVLLKAGAERDAVDAQGINAAEHAQAGLHVELAKRLREME